MKKLKYLISSAGGFRHHFEIARILYSRNQLHKVISGYPWFKLKREKIPKNYIEYFGLFQMFSYLLRKINYNIKYLENVIANIDVLNLKNIDRMSSKHTQQADVFLSLSQTGLNTGKKIKKSEKIYICERDSAHILEQEKILSEEYKALNLPTFKINKWAVERELQEYEESDIILVNSTFIKKTFSKYEKNLKKVHVLNFGVNLNDFNISYPNKKDNNYFDILFIGSLSIRKGLHYLIDAFHKFKHPNKRLHIVGSHSNDINFFKSKIKHEKIYLYNHIEFSKLKDILHRSHIFVLPSLEDGFAQVVTYALACGCPVIVSENTGSEEIVRRNDCGFVVPIRDAKIIADKLTLLSDDKQLFEKFSNNASKMSKQHSWENYVDQLDRMVEQYKKDKI